MQATTSTPMLWTEMTDDLSEAVNGGKYDYYNCYEKPKKEKSERYYKEYSYCYEDQKYDKCNSYNYKW